MWCSWHPLTQHYPPKVPLPAVAAFRVAVLLTYGPKHTMHFACKFLIADLHKSWASHQDLLYDLHCHCHVKHQGANTKKCLLNFCNAAFSRIQNTSGALLRAVHSTHMITRYNTVAAEWLKCTSMKARTSQLVFWGKLPNVNISLWHVTAGRILKKYFLREVMFQF